MCNFELDWRWTISFIDPSCDGSACIKVARSLEEALELGLRLRHAGLEVRRIMDPAGFEIPIDAVACYERLKPLYRTGADESLDCGPADQPNLRRQSVRK